MTRRESSRTSSVSKRPLVVAAAGVLFLVASVAVVWPKEELPAPEVLPPAVLLPRVFTPVAVEATAEQQALTLFGIVRDATGRPVPNATVSLSASTQQSLATSRCGSCGELLFSCSARETPLEVAALISRNEGLLVPALTTRSDSAGKFRFERLAGVSFTVWASAPGLGEGVHERAAPGELVEVFLPSLRSIGGSVLDDQGGPLSGATIHAISLRLPVEHHATSRPDGTFELSGLGEGPFYVLAEKRGYLPEAHAKVEAGPTPLTLRLTAPRTLKIKVVKGGVPTEAEVRVEADHLSRTGRALKGELKVEGLFPDSVTVVAAEGPLCSPPRTLVLTERVSEVTLELEPSGRLLVTPVDADGQPVPNPTLLLMSQNGTLVEKRVAKTGELVVFPSLAPGDYFLNGEAEGFKAILLPVKVAPKEASLELVMEKGTLIRGRVLDEYGRPAASVSVLVGPTGEVVFADEAGKFSVLVPSPGQYTLHAHHSEWGGGEVKVSAPADDVVLSLEAKGGVRIVVMSQGRRVEGADAMLWLDRNDVFRSDRPSGADGVVMMRGLPPGDYWLRASHAEYLPSDRQKVTVVDGELKDVAAELASGSKLTGEVVDEGGNPVPMVSVGLVPRGVAPQLTDGRGHFEFRALRPKVLFRVEVHDDRYEQLDAVEARAGGEPVKVRLRKLPVFRGRVLGEGGAPLKRFRINEQEVTTSDGRFELPLSASEDQVAFGVEAAGYEPQVVEVPASPELGDIQLERAAELLGVVRDVNGSPVSEAVVTCDFCGESSLTDSDGRYTLPIPRGVALFTVEAKKGNLTGSVQASSGGPPPDLRLQPAVRVFGTVWLAEGKPAAGHEVALASGNTAEPITTVTDEAGRYSAEVAPGTCRIGFQSRQEPDRALWLMVDVQGTQQQVDLGPAPGTSSVSVQVPPTQGLALWVARGVSSISDPPFELLDAPYVQTSTEVKPGLRVVQGLPPGDYLFVLTNMREGGTVGVKQVRVPQSSPVVF